MLFVKVELYNLQFIPFTYSAAPSFAPDFSKVQSMICVSLPMTYNAPPLLVALQPLKVTSLIITSLPVANIAPPSTLDESLPSSI